MHDQSPCRYGYCPRQKGSSQLFLSTCNPWVSPSPYLIQGNPWMFFKHEGPRPCPLLCMARRQCTWGRKEQYFFQQLWLQPTGVLFQTFQDIWASHHQPPYGAFPRSPWLLIQQVYCYGQVLHPLHLNCFSPSETWAADDDAGKSEHSEHMLALLVLRQQISAECATSGQLYTWFLGLHTLVSYAAIAPFP